jgi:hypothetical protein
VAVFTVIVAHCHTLLGGMLQVSVASRDMPCHIMAQLLSTTAVGAVPVSSGCDRHALLDGVLDGWSHPGWQYRNSRWDVSFRHLIKLIKLVMDS